MNVRVYLAGPEVFLPNAREIGARKRAICERHGLVGIFPGDEEDALDPALTLGERALAIGRAMESAMRGCDAMIVNLTPFRGPSADVGAAYEMGFMRALGRPIFGYSNDARLFLERVTAFWGGAVRLRATGEHEDADGMAIEPFELHDQRAAARFHIALQPDHSPAGFHLRFACHAAFDDWAVLSEGAYLLRSNITDWSDQQLWKAYIQLTQAEAAFRIQKDQLNVRPIWHQREDRVQAHILVCFLAFVLWKCLEMWQSRAGLGNAPRTILEELARIQSHDVLLPTASHGVIRLRCVTQLDAAQAALLDRLGLTLPKRMRLAEHELPALTATA